MDTRQNHRTVELFGRMVAVLLTLGWAAGCSALLDTDSLQSGRKDSQVQPADGQVDAPGIDAKIDGKPKPPDARPPDKPKPTDVRPPDKPKPTDVRPPDKPKPTDVRPADKPKPADAHRDAPPADATKTDAHLVDGQSSDGPHADGQPKDGQRENAASDAQPAQ